MKKIVFNVIPPLISLLLVMLGNGFFTTFTSLRLSGYGIWVVGIVNASFFAGIMLGSIYVEKLLDRIGHIRTFAIFASTNSFLIVIQSMVVTPLLWILFRFLSGICTSGFFIVIESWLLLSTGVKHRGRILSLYMLTLYMGLGLGQFILNISSLTSFLPFVVTIGLSSLSIIPICMIKSSGPLVLESSITNILQIIRKAPLGPIGCFIAGVIMASLYGLVPIFGKEIGLTVFQISQIMGFTILGGLLLQWPIGHLSDIFNRRKVLIGICFLLMVLTLIIFFFYSFSYYVLLALMILFGGVSFTFYPLSITYTCDYFSDKNLIGIACSLLVIYGIGSIVGPLFSPIFMTWFGSNAVFLYMSLFCCSYIFLAVWRVMHAKPSREEKKSDYLPLPRATSLAFYLDPRNEFGDEGEDEEYEDDRYLLEEDEDEDEDEENV